MNPLALKSIAYLLDAFIAIKGKTKCWKIYVHVYKSLNQIHGHDQL